ncbi:MAG TPA: putative glycolipid-binding domain-containing protein [Gemmatimonadaceae bacterium]|nr:putative glycolipid-binding domain-containing protein [Gemmatimonadaceae bacterium]
MNSHQTILRRCLDLSGHEVAELRALDTGWRLSGVAVLAHDARPCRLDYDIECDSAWRIRRATVRGHVGGSRLILELARDDASAWTANGAPAPALAGCIDVDLGFSPSTNLLPIRRLALDVGAHAPVRAAWVRFPDLTLAVFEQVYTRTGEATYLYESGGGTFRRELTVSAEGFVLEYPDFWLAEAVSAPEEMSS